MDIVLGVLQIVFTAIAGISALVAAVFAYKIGTTQNGILALQDYAEVFLMPQNIIDSQQNIVGWNILIKNASAYPIYISSYVLNGVEDRVGGSVVPNNSDNWYTVPITSDIKQRGQFSIKIYYDDYKGKKYETDGFGTLNGNAWKVTTTKRISL